MVEGGPTPEADHNRFILDLILRGEAGVRE